MALIKEGLWKIVTGNENAPKIKDNKQMLDVKRSCFSDDCAIRGSNAVVLAWTRPSKSSCSLEKVGRSIPEENMGEQIGPTKKVVQFEVKDGQSMQKHVKMLIEIFDELSIIGDPLDEENQVVHLLASLAESYDMLVTALESSPEVPKLQIVTERLLYEDVDFVVLVSLLLTLNIFHIFF